MIRLSGVSKSYGRRGQEVRALGDVSLEVSEGEFVAIVGRSGSGKSTLLAILGLVERPDAGSYQLDGADVATLNDIELSKLRAKTFGFVFQDFHLLSERTAAQNVVYPMQFGGVNVSERTPRAGQLLSSVSLGDRLHSRPSELSGGEQQRVAVARSLANDPRVILADEPTGNLDTATRDSVMELLKDQWRAGRTLIVVTHDLQVAAQASRVIEMADGRVVTKELVAT
ncbi:MAG: ABC transporter ATP-binding protein [Trueperaceae bacterium]|nr:ABC transporter ATP-binding protein [Trueperaceae bacterium]